jgi:hypothetical protein
MERIIHCSLGRGRHAGSGSPKSAISDSLAPPAQIHELGAGRDSPEPLSDILAETAAVLAQPSSAMPISSRHSEWGPTCAYEQ